MLKFAQSAIRVGCSGMAATASRTTLQKFVSSPSQRSRMFSSISHVFEISNSEDFNEKVLGSVTPVVVDFYADWCGPCRGLGPRLEAKVEGRDGTVLMAKVNVDYAGEVAMDYDVSAVPTVMFIKDGQVTASFQGAVDDAEIDMYLDDLLKD